MVSASYKVSEEISNQRHPSLEVHVMILNTKYISESTENKNKAVPMLQENVR